MKTWLCLGDKDKGIIPCGNAEIVIVENHQGSYWLDTKDNEKKYFTSLTIYCKRMKRYIHHYVVRCKGYYNTTLGDF